MGFIKILCHDLFLDFVKISSSFSTFLDLIYTFPEITTLIASRQSTNLFIIFLFGPFLNLCVFL